MGSVFDHATHTFQLDFGHEKQTFYSATVILGAFGKLRKPVFPTIFGENPSFPTIEGCVR